MSNQRKRWTDKDKKELLELVDLTSSALFPIDYHYLNTRLGRSLTPKSWDRVIREFRKEISLVDCNCNQCGKSVG